MIVSATVTTGVTALDGTMGDEVETMMTANWTTTGSDMDCGNGEVDEGEECDGIDWQGATCESLGYVPGLLSCTMDCEFDVAHCVPAGMVLVPGGVFEMGSDDAPIEQPIRVVDVDSFYIDEVEVTVGEYEICVDRGVCDLPVIGEVGVNSCNYMVVGRGGHPVNCVSWYQAVSYCAWVDGGVKHLPTEAEWEKAARGTDARTYPWGDTPEPSCARLVMNEEGGQGCGTGATWAVGSKPLGISPYSGLDMAGNVREWVNDWYAWYDAEETDNPTGPRTGMTKSLRGGAFSNVDAGNFRTSIRSGAFPYYQGGEMGFRCGQALPARELE
jgi:sulfatase modifying factor 1